MTRLERFDNHNYDNNDLIRRKKRLILRIIMLFAGLTLVIVAATGLYLFRDPIHDTADHVAATVRNGIRTHFPDGVDSDAIVPFLKDMFGGQDSPVASPRETPATATTDASAAFLYTVELTDGGRIEGKTISVDKETVTIADDSGVKVQVGRNRVARITKLPR